MHQQVGVKKIHQLLNELPVDKDELNRRSKFFATFMERLAFMVNPNLDYKFAPSKG